VTDSAIQRGVERMMLDIEMEVRETRSLIGKAHLDGRVMRAMRQVPRHEFVPPDMLELAYRNGPLAIGCGQTISQPYIVALMTDLLNIGEDSVVLEVGTGSGYQSAVLAQIAKQVYSLEIIAELADQAVRRLRRLGYANVHVRTGDGYYGWSEYAPFDGIIVTAAAVEVPTPLIEQLKPGARLVIPVGAPYMAQELCIVTKDPTGGISQRDVLGVAFVPMTGERHVAQ